MNSFPSVESKNTSGQEHNGKADKLEKGDGDLAKDIYDSELDAGGSRLNQIGLGNLSLLTSVPTGPDDEYYDMNHKKAGLCLIFNMKVFLPELELPERKGTEKDAINLENTFRDLGFDVVVFHNVRWAQVRKTLADVATLDHRENDSFVLCYLSHGFENTLYAYDMPFTPSKLWEDFTSDNCPTLAGKPKLFFIQACQGSRYQESVHVKHNTCTDSSSNSYKIPTHADFLFAFSTIPGFYSWRNTDKGAWFIQALCSEIQKHAFSEDLLSMLVRVNRRVAINFESQSSSRDQHGKKQVPFITNTLLRRIVFQKKT